jgi:hypothetical protein
LGRGFPIDLLVRRSADVDRRLRLGDFFIKEIVREGKVLYERADRVLKLKVALCSYLTPLKLRPDE